MMLQVIKESLFIFCALSLGIYVYRITGLFFRLMFFQVLLLLITYIASYGITIYQQLNGIQQNNQWLYNLHMPIDTALLVAAAYNNFQDRRGKYLSVLFFIFYISVFCFQINLAGVKKIANYAYVAECFIITMLYAKVLYQNFNRYGSIRTLTAMALNGSNRPKYGQALVYLFILHVTYPI
jgi:hypothetical protein